MNTLRQKVQKALFTASEKQAILAFLEICGTECQEIASEIAHPQNGQFDATPSNAVVSVLYQMFDSLLEGND